MRLTSTEINAIRGAVRQVLGHTAQVRVFGSRLRDDLGGGDIILHERGRAVSPIAHVALRDGVLL